METVYSPIGDEEIVYSVWKRTGEIRLEVAILINYKE
nr:MAG TPA: hypothetical protein [Caudoviricetes sp.]